MLSLINLMIYFSNFFTRKKEKKIQVSKSFFFKAIFTQTDIRIRIRISETKTARKIEINFFKKVFLPVQND